MIFSILGGWEKVLIMDPRIQNIVKYDLWELWGKWASGDWVLTVSYPTNANSKMTYPYLISLHTSTITDVDIV